MSLTPFDNLRSIHPDARGVITAIERLVNQTLRLDPHAVIDDDIIVQQSHVDPTLVRHLLVELVAIHALVRRAFWVCPERRGTTLEASTVKDFPPTIECSQCGHEHLFTSKDVEVKFLPSEALLREIRTTPER